MSSKEQRFLRPMVEGLRKLAEWAGRVPSLGYGLTYLAAIPLFAAFYVLLPHDFFHATARYEPFVVEQGKLLASTLRHTYLMDIRDGGKYAPTLNGRPVSQEPNEDYPLFDIRPSPEHVDVIVQMLATGDRPPDLEPWVTVALDLGTTPTTIEHPHFSEADWYNKELLSVSMKPRVISGGNVDVAALFPCHGGIRTTCLRMTTSDYYSITTLADTAAGKPSRLQNSYVRMLYFSAVTISTLGYGDIVPITSRARLLVTIQAILGPLLFGLFLNSLVKEGAEHLRENVQSDYRKWKSSEND